MADRAAGNEGYRTGPYISGRFLLVPSTARGNGIGHCKRTIALLKSLPDACIYVPGRGGAGFRGYDELKDLFSSVDRKTILTSLSGPSDFRVTITDMRKTPSPFFSLLLRGSRTVGIDEGGKQRERFDYLIDTFPRLRRRNPANTASPLFLDLPKRKRDPGTEPGNPLQVLLAFGGEDPMALTGKTVKMLQRPALRGHAVYTVLYGPAASRKPLPEGVRELKKTDDLKESLADFDLVVTAFGLTAYEAAAAGCAVLCVNPGIYHHRLAGAAGFVRAGIKRPRYRSFLRAVREPGRLGKQTQAVFDRAILRAGGGMRAGRGLPDYPDLAGFIERLDFSQPRVCPVCGGIGNPAAYRDEKRSIFSCRKCRLYYQVMFSGEKTRYGEDYFFAEYKRQYGRTYLEDFAHIKTIGKKRLELIRSVLSRSAEKNRGWRLLDVGCAYGAFLDAAVEAGFQVKGTDISEEAAAYVRDRLGLPAEAGNFEKEYRYGIQPGAGGPGRYDAVTMWFVLEHFQNTAKILRNVHSLLTDGGVFAFSTPNGNGISRRTGPRKFFAANPPDHFSIWTPKAARKVLPRFGLNVVQVKITGHHPERYFRPARRGAGRAHGKGALYRMGIMVSKLFRLGDTFEVYAVKRGKAEPGTWRGGRGRV